MPGARRRWRRVAAAAARAPTAPGARSARALRRSCAKREQCASSRPRVVLTHLRQVAGARGDRACVCSRSGSDAPLYFASVSVSSECCEAFGDCSPAAFGILSVVCLECVKTTAAGAGASVGVGGECEAAKQPEAATASAATAECGRRVGGGGGGERTGGGGGAGTRTATVETQAPATLAAAECARYVDAARTPHPRMLPRSSTLDPERSSPCGEQYSTATMTNDQGLFTKIKESSLSISLTAALILVASIVVIISSITIQSAYMWLAVGATAVLFLGFCSCTTCEKTSHFHFRRGSIHSDSVSTISDGRDNFYEVGHLQNTPPYWIADLPPSYAVATATSMAPDCQLPPPYSAVADVHAPLRVYSDLNKPASGGESAYIDAPPPPPPLASPALAPAPHAPPPPAPAPAHVDTAVAVDCDVTGSPLHVPSSDARPPTNHRSVGTRTATSVGTDAMHAAGCCCDACIEGPC